MLCVDILDKSGRILPPPLVLHISTLVGVHFKYVEHFPYSLPAATT